MNEKTRQYLSDVLMETIKGNIEWREKVLYPANYEATYNGNRLELELNLAVSNEYKVSYSFIKNDTELTYCWENVGIEPMYETSEEKFFKMFLFIVRKSVEKQKEKMWQVICSRLLQDLVSRKKGIDLYI